MITLGDIIQNYTGVIVEGALKDLMLTIVSTLIALLLGILGAAGRLYGNRVIRTIVVWYVEIIRGLPPILQLFIIYFGLNQFGIYLSPIGAGLLWLVAYGAGYSVEIFRSGIMNVARGQKEAASALGMSQWLIMRKIVIPQAFVVMLPVLMNFIVLQLKNTTLLYLVGYADAMYQARLGTDATAHPTPLYLMAAICYMILSWVIGLIGHRMEQKAAAYR